MSVTTTSQPESGLNNPQRTNGKSTTTDHVAKAAHASVDKAAANLASAERALRDAQEAAGVKVSDMSAQAQQIGLESLSSVRKYVGQHPVQSVGIALASGYLLSLILKK